METLRTMQFNQNCRYNISASQSQDVSLTLVENPSLWSNKGGKRLEILNVGYDCTMKIEQWRGTARVEIQLKRMSVPVLLEVVVPSGLLVMVSWVSDC